MKKGLSMILLLALLAIPTLSALAEYGWEGNLFHLYDVGITFAVSESWTVMSDEELVALRDAQSNPEPDDPTVIFFAGDMENTVMGVIGAADVDDPTQVEEVFQRLLSGTESKPVTHDTVEEVMFFGVEATKTVYRMEIEGVEFATTYSYIFSSDSCVYMLSIMGRSEVLEAFLKQLTAPMAGE